MPAFAQVALTFIGGGVLATSIIDGLLEDTGNKAGRKLQYNISITARREDHAASLRQRYPRALVTTDNRDSRLWEKQFPSKSEDGGVEITGTAPIARIVLICTQPQFTSIVCEDMRHVMAHHSLVPDPIFVTMCPGITIQQLEGWLDKQVPIVRTMPNTPVSVRQGATAMFASAVTSQSDIQQVTALFRPISPCICILPQEELLNVAASVSGSSPAYFFTLLDMLVQAATARGFPAEMASSLVIQSCFGSALLAHSANMPLEALIKDVCVPGGSTQKAVNCFHERGLFETVDAGVECSLVANRSMGGE